MTLLCEIFKCNLLLHLSRSEDDLDSDIEETLYGHVHYASSLLVSENSTPGTKFLNTVDVYYNIQVPKFIAHLF